MKFLIVISLLLYCSALFGQHEKLYWDLIESRLRELQPLGKIYYSEKPPPEIIGKTVKYLNKKEMDRAPAVTFSKDPAYVLTEVEWAVIRRKIRAGVLAGLPDSIFQNSKSVPVDSLNSFVESYNKSIIDSVARLPVAQRPSWDILKWAYYFSKPIYLRNNTLLFYFFMYFRHSSGSHCFYLSKLDNGHWQRGVCIAGGDW